MAHGRVTTRVVNMAVEAVWAFKVRSLFVIFGVAFGIASLTLIVTAVDGANRKAHEIVDMFGPDSAFVLGGNIEKRAAGFRSMTMTWSDVYRIRQSLPGARLVVPMRSVGTTSVKRGAANYNVDRIIGATADYASSWDWPLAEGRDLSREDVDRGAKVCLLGEKVSRELFGDESPLGKVIFIKGIPTQVVGRLVYRGFSGGGGNIDNRIIMPLTTLTQRFNLDRKYFRAIRVKFLDQEYMASQVENLRSLLRSLHNLKEGDDDDFTILTADEVLNFLSMLKGGLVVFLGVTATIAVLVGGFVLANLFSISVSERSREIGLKKALGARNSAIMLQFLVEASVLTLMGGLLGLFMGLGLGQLLTRLDILTIQFSWHAFFIALISALGIGLVFGLKPARTAATMDPIQALQGGE